MIIEDALERAKRQRQGMARTGLHTGDAWRHDPAGAGPVNLEFERIDYDLAACEANRIMVPEVEGPDTSAALTAYRMLRTRVLHRMRHNRWTTLAVTSPGPGEGKSVTALNVALSMAREKNQNVFLLDLDMNNPSICPYLGIAPRHGIVRFLAGQVEARDVFFRIGVDRLAIAGGVETTPYSSELLASGRLDVLLDYIRSIAPQPLVVIDLPPVLATDDFLVAATRIDATLLVLCEGKTRRDGVQRTMELLSGFPIVGVLLNRSHERVVDYYGHRYYSQAQ